eukprot:767291-Hanusia_phi.AAC.1
MADLSGCRRQTLAAASQELSPVSAMARTQHFPPTRTQGQLNLFELASLDGGINCLTWFFKHTFLLVRHDGNAWGDNNSINAVSDETVPSSNRADAHVATGGVQVQEQEEEANTRLLHAYKAACFVETRRGMCDVFAHRA